MGKGLGTARKLAVGVGMGLFVAVPATAIMAGTAGASSPTCYTGCTSPSTGLPVTSGGSTAATTAVTVTDASTSTTTTSPSGLAFTGADISELVIISAGALGAGTVLVRLSRKRRQEA